MISSVSPQNPIFMSDFLKELLISQKPLKLDYYLIGYIREILRFHIKILSKSTQDLRKKSSIMRSEIFEM